DELPPGLAGASPPTDTQPPLGDDRALWQADGRQQPQRASDGELSALDLVAVDTMLNAHLHAQLNVLSLSPRDLMLARTVVESLDDDGYLRTPLEELAELAELARRIVEEHLQALAARNLHALAVQLGEPIERVDAACERIRRLDPRPGWRYGSSHIPYVVPDVIVKRIGGQWVTVLNPAVVPRVRLNQTYAELF